jgi:hypothetical protein
VAPANGGVQGGGQLTSTLTWFSVLRLVYNFGLISERT